MLTGVGLVAVLFLAFANGANDNAKPVASLVGAGLAAPRRALRWGTAATFLGALAGIVLGQALAAGFAARGLVPAGTAAAAPFLVAVGVGAALTVLLATRLGYPISTTHALIGAIAGAGLAAGPFAATRLGAVFLLPLLTSPVVALAATAFAYPVLHRWRRRAGIGRETCVCVGESFVAQGGAAVRQWTASWATTAECRDRYRGTVAGVDAAAVAAGAHWCSALALSAGRGLQDAAKISGIGFVLAGAGARLPVALGVAAAMAAGGLLAARRVEATMAHGISRMNDGQGLLANLVAAGLVFAATPLGLPVSTTHVTTGAIAGLRRHTERPDESRLGSILLAWGLTLPLAAALAAGAFLAADS